MMKWMLLCIGFLLSEGKLSPATRDKHPQLGIEHLSRQFLRQDELDWINGVENPVTDLFSELNSRGLLMRPGSNTVVVGEFIRLRWKKTTHLGYYKWRMMLLQTGKECLSVRLAEGVNKGWVIAIKRGAWNFLVISRHLPGR